MNLWILGSDTLIKVHKNEIGVSSSCYEQNTIYKEVILEKFRLTLRADTTPRYDKFTQPRAKNNLYKLWLKNRFQNSQGVKKIPTYGFHRLQSNLKQSFRVENEKNGRAENREKLIRRKVHWKTRSLSKNWFTRKIIPQALRNKKCP